MGLLEEWRPVTAPGYETHYEVSNLGNVRSVARKVAYRDGRCRLYPSIELKPSSTPAGYLVVTLSNGKRQKRVRLVHHLVMEAFVGERPYKYDTCHGNNDKADNRLSNLRYDTREGNLKDSASLAEKCKRGHRISGANVSAHYRRCLACRRAGSFCQYYGRKITQEISDAYYREILGRSLPGDDDIIGRKFKRSTKND